MDEEAETKAIEKWLRMVDKPKALDMKLLKVEISKSQLSQIPENERVFFVLLGSLLNDLNMFQKLAYFSANTKTSKGIVRGAQNFQALSLAQFQAAKLYDGWVLLQQNFFGTKVSKQYVSELSGSGKSDLTKLKQYFNRQDNLLYVIRNMFVAHYTSDWIETLLSEIPDSEVFYMLFSELQGNCFYSMSNELTNLAILKATGQSNIDDGMKKLLGDVMKVTRLFANFLGDCLRVIVEKHLGLGHSEVEIPDPPDMNEIALPYFIKGTR
ncbi:MAG TPA: hypothetical protein VMW72_21535 [Sedimentisphaerales bacterium]|nr:hypothetical protein [Sedimentisphaerales bacterium]